MVAPGIVDERPGRERQLVRFLAFGIVLLVAVLGLTARMVYLQLVSGTTYTQLATSNSTFQQAIPSTRGLIYDRNGVLLVSNQPSYTVEIRPSDLPFDQRATVVAQLASLLKMDAADINSAIDGNPGSTFDLVRIASGVPVATANLIAEEHLDLPGVEVSVDALRHYTDGALMSQILGYTGPIDAATLKRLKSMGYLADDLIGRAGVEEQYETQLRGTYGMETIQRDATGRQIQVLSTDSQPVAGDSLDPHGRFEDAAAGPDGRRLGDEGIPPQVGGPDRDQSADRRDPGHGQHADLRRQRLRPGDLQRPVQGAPQQPRQAAPESCDRASSSRRARPTSWSLARAPWPTAS